MSTASQTPAPPVPPDISGLTIDEGPLRRELLDQIAVLEQELSLETTRAGQWANYRANRRRGPRWQSTAALEEIRDELVDALMSVHAGTYEGRP